MPTSYGRTTIGGHDYWVKDEKQTRDAHRLRLLTGRGKPVRRTQFTPVNPKSPRIDSIDSHYDSSRDAPIRTRPLSAADRREAKRTAPYLGAGIGAGSGLVAARQINNVIDTVDPIVQQAQGKPFRPRSTLLSEVINRTTRGVVDPQNYDPGARIKRIESSKFLSGLERRGDKGIDAAWKLAGKPYSVAQQMRKPWGGLLRHKTARWGRGAALMGAGAALGAASGALKARNSPTDRVTYGTGAMRKINVREIERKNWRNKNWQRS